MMPVYHSRIFQFGGMGEGCEIHLLLLYVGSYEYQESFPDLDFEDGSAGAAQKSNKNIWERRTDLGQEEEEAVTLPTRHQNKIMELRSVNQAAFSSVGWDGNLVLWPYTACKVQVN